MNTFLGIPTGVKSWLEMSPETADDWVVEHLIYRETIALLDGIGASGKSYLALQLALSVASGLPFLGIFPVVKGRVLVFNGEDPESISHGRFRKIAEQFSKEISTAKLYTAAENITYISLTSLSISSVLLTDKLQPTDLYAALSQFCKAWRPDLIILDPLSLFLAKENDNSYASQFYSFLRKLKTTVLVIHHQNKSGINGEGEDRTKSRGASVFVENARTRMTLKNSVLDIEKNNYFQPYTVELIFEDGIWKAKGKPSVLKLDEVRGVQKALETQPKRRGRKPQGKGVIYA